MRRYGLPILVILLILSATPTRVRARRTALRIADRFSGGDLGAKINEADSSLGASPGEIRVVRVGVVSSEVVLSPNHTLRLLAPTTWTAGAVFQSGDSLICAGKRASLTIGPNFSSPKSRTNVVIFAQRAADLVVKGCEVSATSGTNGYLFVRVLGGHHILVAGNVVRNLRLFQSDSAIDEAYNTNIHYSEITDTELSDDIVVEDNVCYGKSEPGGNSNHPAISFWYTRRARALRNTTVNYTDGIVWFGGDACVGGCSNGGNGDPAHPRKVRNITISGNTVLRPASGGIWGSMGDNVTVTRNNVRACGDVCLDTEGGAHVVFSHNSVMGGTNGGITTFWLNRDIRVTNNIVISTSAAQPLFRIYNATQDAGWNTDIYVADNRFICKDSSVCTVDTDGGPVGLLVFVHNFLNDARIQFASNNLHDVDVQDNQLEFRISATRPFTAIDVENANQVHGRPGRVKIVGNRIQCRIEQPAGSMAIRVSQSDFNSSPITEILRNRLFGEHPFPIDIAVSAQSSNPGVEPVFVVVGNALGTGEILRKAAVGARMLVKVDANRATKEGSLQR